MESPGLALGSLRRLSRGVFTGIASEGLEEHVPRGQSHAAWRLSLSTHVRATPCKLHLVLHRLLPVALWPRTWERWECCLSVVASLVGECPRAGFLGGLREEHLEEDAWRACLEEDTWRARLESTPGGHAWRACLEEDTWRTRLEGDTWRKTPGGHTWKETSEGDQLLPRHSPALP